MPRYRFPDSIDTLIKPARQKRPSPIETARDDHTITPLEKKFPHVLEKIQAMWGYPEMNLYFSRLTIDDRGNRDGFPADVWNDLHTLMKLHDLILPDWRK